MHHATHISELITILQRYFNWNKARITCLAQILLGLFAVCTVNLSQLATTFSGNAKTSSTYKRLQRFLIWLSKQQRYQQMITQLILSHVNDEKFILSMDRTNWKFGAADINILVLGLWYRGVSIPLLWFCLNTAGNSNVEEKMRIIVDVLREIPAQRIEYLFADREFVGGEWFAFLIKHKIPFSIRIKDCYYVRAYDNHGYYKTVTVKSLFSGLKKGISHRSKCIIFDQYEVALAACISVDGDLVVIATNTKKPRKALKAYKKRWSIETLFSCLKGRGFNFEDTHLTKSDRIESLLFILSLATFWSMRAGELSLVTEPFQLSSHGRPRTSIFRRGLNLIRRSIIQILFMLDRLIELFYLLDPDEPVKRRV